MGKQIQYKMSEGGYGTTCFASDKVAAILEKKGAARILSDNQAAKKPHVQQGQGQQGQV